MALTKNFKAFDERLLDLHPDLRDVLKPNDKYPELEHILKNRYVTVPSGSFNSKIIINGGEIVERVFKTPKGQVMSLFSEPANVIFDQVA